jgi:hypothetical protein
MEPSEELRATLLRLYDAMSSGSAASVEAFYSLQPGSVFMGTDAAEFWTDSAQHNADVRRFFDGSMGVNRWRGGEALAFEEGTVGWIIDRPTVVLGDGTEFALRISLVWHREGPEWKVVHSHASVGE